MLNATWSVMLELSPWMLFGMLFAGLLHGFMPAGFVHRQLRGASGVVKAVLLGVPLPLCSCGVIPAGLGLKKDGASDGASVGFVISTPQTGVDSILVSASFLGWPFALFKMAAAAVTGVLGGLLVEATDSGSDRQSAATEEGGTTDRSWRGMVDHALDVLESIWLWIVFGVLVAAAIEVYIPESFFTSVAEVGAGVAMLVMLVISLPMYVCATASVPIAASLVVNGFPPGAALVFLMAGPATNVATIGAIYRALGRRPMAIYLLVIITGSVAFGLMFESLISAGVVGEHVHGTHGSWWETIGAVVLTALLARFAGRDLMRWWAMRGAGEQPANALEVSVYGMTCNGCVGRLERTLAEADGVDTVFVSLQPGRAVVTGSIDEASLRALVVDAGFETQQAG